MGRPTRITDQKKEQLFEALREGLPISYACDYIGIPRQTIYDWMKRNDDFRTQITLNKAIAIKGLVALTSKQGGAWKLLKNLAKDEFKEHIEVEENSTHTFVLETGDGEHRFKA